MIKASGNTHRVRGAAAVLCSEVPALQHSLAGSSSSAGKQPKRTLSTFALSISPGFACSIVRFGLPWRLVGTLVSGVLYPLYPLLLLLLLLLFECLKRVGSESLLVNGGRGMLATSIAYAAVGMRNLLSGPP